MCVCESVTKSKYQFLFYHDHATANGDRGIFSTMAAKLFKLYGTIVTYKCTYVSCDLLQYITERIILFCEQSYVNQLFFSFFFKCFKISEGARVVSIQQTESRIKQKLELDSPSLWWAFSPLDFSTGWLSRLGLVIYMFVVINFDALVQASDFQIHTYI